MISAIIDTLNAKLSLLTYFEKRYCLTELKTETKGETEITSPVHYVGSEDWEKIQVDKYRGVSYWRKSGTPSVERVDELGNAKDFVTVTFPLQLVGYVRRKDTTINDEYSPDRIANALVKQLNFKNGELKTTLKAKRVISSVTDYSTDSAEIWEEETNGTGLVDVPYKFAVVSLSVEIEVLARIDCLETECDQDSDILHAFDFCKPSVQDRLTATQITCLEDWICGDPDPVQIQVNGVNTETAESGTTYDQAIHDSAGSDVGTASNPSVVSDATVENSDASYSGTVKAEGSLVLPDITFTDSDGSTSSVPSVQDITATPCGASGGSISVALSDSSPRIGDTVTITATPSGFTPDSYLFYAYDTINDEMVFIAEQVGNSFDWTIPVISATDYVIYVSATESGTPDITAFGTINVTINQALLLDTTEGASANFAFAPFRLSSTFSNPVALIRRSSDNAQKSFYFDSNDLLSLDSEDGGGTSLSSWIGSDDGYLVTGYSQDSSGLTFTANSASLQALIVSSGSMTNLNGLATMVMNGDYYQISSSINVRSTFVAVQKTGNTVINFITGGNIQGLYIGGTLGSVDGVGSFRGYYLNTEVNYSTPLIASHIQDTGIYVDGVLRASGSQSDTTLTRIGARGDAGTLNFVGKASVIICYPNYRNSQRQTIESIINNWFTTSIL